MTSTDTYDADLQAAQSLIEQFIDPLQCDGNGRNWIGDALNDSWIEGITVAQWAARAVASVPAGFRRSAS